MFIGHWAPALALAARPKAPGIGTLFVAGQLVDWAFFGLLLTGTEAMRVTPGISVMNPMDLYHMPYTHSLLGSAGFAAAFGALVLGLTKSRAAAGIAALVVLSHWFMDLLVHVPDLTLAGSPPKLGLGLWNHPAIEMPLELGLTFGALWLYVRARRPSALRVGVLAAVLLALQAVNWFGPVEPEVTTGTSLLAFVAFGAATLAAWWMGKSAANSARTG
ncbi:hypothetical protein [Novosphingobium sp.]|uniref:hypothetical protein n=1 Tax=Novosphingobium sp. TaxID=1874826 RepID=UPI0027336BED|nr:hypothetical protein [Novosphingobium sp.]MDP3907130.1 hypothetical protein [Novosphingobium sp.]